MNKFIINCQYTFFMWPSDGRKANNLNFDLHEVMDAQVFFRSLLDRFVSNRIAKLTAEKIRKGFQVKIGRFLIAH